LVFYAQGLQQFASLENFELETGVTIRNCKIGFRTFGQLNKSRSNAVLVCGWFTGQSEGVSSAFINGGLVDTSRFFVIVADALGNGISFSPSNYKTSTFPEISVKDMVKSQYQLTTKQLDIAHLDHVIGISMGGMQVFEWMVSFPLFMDKAIAIVGSPRLSAYDKLLWNTELSALEAARNCKACLPAAKQTVAMIHELHLYTPSYRAQKTSSNQYDEFVKTEVQFSKKFSHLDYAAQLKSMISHDAIGGRSWQELKELIKAKVLVVVATKDLMVNPVAAIEFATQLNFSLVELKGNCGHQTTMTCDKELLKKTVIDFIKD